MAALGLTQRDLGERAGLSKSAITRILKGERNPQTRTLERLAAALEVPLAQLVEPPEQLGAAARPGRARAPVLTSGTRPTGPGGTGAAELAVPPDDRRSGALAVWYPVYYWAMRVDARRPEAAPQGTYFERPVPVGEETERIGEAGFGLLLLDASLSNWEGAEGQPLGRGWIVWCNPDARGGVQDGDLVVAEDPARGLLAAVYRQTGATDDGPYLETDDADLREQVRRRTAAEQVLGPVVMVSLLGGVPRRRQRPPAGDVGG
jgi:transcriptional regulator with XRE-family HTH domain